MPQSCTICCHPEHASINNALIEKDSFRNIAKRFGTTTATLHRHRQHLPSHLIKGKQAVEVAEATTLLTRLESLIRRLDTIAQGAQEDRAWSAAAAAIREIRGCLTVLAQLNGELQVAERLNISISLVSERVQASLLNTKPEEFGRFWGELLAKATNEQRAAALCATRPVGLDMSTLTDEELALIDAIYKRVARQQADGSANCESRSRRWADCAAAMAL